MEGSADLGKGRETTQLAADAHAVLTWFKEMGGRVRTTIKVFEEKNENTDSTSEGFKTEEAYMKRRVTRKGWHKPIFLVFT